MTQATDPVCGMMVDTQTGKFKSEYQGQTYYFCAPGCKKAFDTEPAKYLAQGQTNEAVGGQEHQH